MEPVAVRPYRPGDAGRAVEFLNACHAADATLAPVNPDGWREFVGRSHNRRGRDFAFAEASDGVAAGLLVAYDADDVRHFRIFVHPDRRRAGVGTRLLESREARGPAVDQCNCPASWTAGAAFLAHHGFAPRARSLDMAREGPAPPAVAPPSGIRLRPDAGARDDAAWIALSEEGYRGTPGYTPLTAGDLAGYRAGPGFDLTVAEDRATGRVVGLCHVFRWQGTQPFLNSVVVAPDARGKGLGRALTVAGVRALAAAGHARVELNVRADNAPAVRIYESLGFRTVAEVTTWRRRR